MKTGSGIDQPAVEEDTIVRRAERRAVSECHSNSTVQNAFESILGRLTIRLPDSSTSIVAQVYELN